jgi:prepilin-type N-terminal cleavage/methylation domain-containing protein
MPIRQANICKRTGANVANWGDVSFAQYVMLRKHRHHARGFTLLESLLAITIVGSGVLALIAAQQAFHKQNDWASHSSTALLLANELRELTLHMPLHDPITGVATLGPEAGETGAADYDDIDDFAGVVDEAGFGSGLTLDPPINALRETIAGMDGWSQVIDVQGVDPTDISASTPQPLDATNMLRVRVTVRYQSPHSTTPQIMAELTWVVGE